MTPVSMRPADAGGSVSAAAISGQDAASLAVHAGPRIRLSGLQTARQIVQSEGIRGLYRGFGMSIATFVPTSGIWWGAYGAYQKVVWKQVQVVLKPFPILCS
jgi:solute carrier family 25 protein 44